MPWYFPWSDAIKKRAIRYLLQRYVGQFLEEKLSLDQLTVDLYNGTGAIKELTLDVAALNEVADQLNLPVKFVDGYIGEICVSVPWHALLSESCFVEVSGLMVTIEPKQRSEDVSMVDSMIESMSMTTSMQIAQECLNHHEEESEMEDPVGKDSSQMIEGIEHFAQAIDTVLNRIKVRFLDIIIRLEHTPKGSQSGVSLEVRIKKVDYFDEAGLESGGSKVSGDSYKTADTSPTEGMLRNKQKPMDPHDYRKVESELRKELRSNTVASQALNLHQGWSVTPLEDSDDEFVPMSSGPGIMRNMSSSQLSGCSDMESSFGSNMSGSTVKSATVGTSTTPSFRYTGVGVMMGDHAIGGSTKKKSEHGSKLMDDPSAVVTHFRVQRKLVRQSPVLSVEGKLPPSSLVMAKQKSLPSLQKRRKF
ncbi:Autophagy-related protein 2-like protein B [Penaeus vannamei]|uniref:Autophagy-related protein 2 n=1 Tax=Penaeus vannamei TaxID=6689 RepID=A0A3R7Q5A2_PENVA|nr:Autophagy-related protein 2-like protein B [Penaeus vannamei]